MGFDENDKKMSDLWVQKTNIQGVIVVAWDLMLQRSVAGRMAYASK